jgi:hypothetical protein
VTASKRGAADLVRQFLPASSWRIGSGSVSFGWDRGTGPPGRSSSSGIGHWHASHAGVQLPTAVGCPPLMQLNPLVGPNPRPSAACEDGQACQAIATIIISNMIES